jgi:hypothetical protein
MKGYTVFKRNPSHADALAAIGAADMLRHLEPHITESAGRFDICLKRPLTPADLETVDPGFSYLERPGKKPPSLPPERVLRIQSASGDPGKSGASLSDNRMYSILGRMKAYGGPNKLVSRFARMSRESWTRAVWECLHGKSGFVFSSPLVQLFNPHSCRGYAMLKANGTNRSDKTKDRWAEPFLEWLRFRGYFQGAAGWFTSGDLRLFCPVPTDVSYDQFAAVAAAFRELRLGGSAVKMDCRAMLSIARLLIENAGEWRPPCRSIRAVWVTNYKDMGQAHTVIGMEQLSLPDWFELRTSEDAQVWLRILEEHDTVVRRLADDHSDEFALLKQYRRTFQSRWDNALPDWVEFLKGYSMLLFRRRAQDHWLLPQFTLAGVTPILERDPELRGILRNPGFLAITAAIRSATVGAQAARYGGKVAHRELRHGLLQQIRRAESLGAGALLEMVCWFISEFNREGDRRRAAGLKARRIERHELDAFAGLLAAVPDTLRVGSVACGLSACLPGPTGKSEAERQLAQAASA